MYNVISNCMHNSPHARANILRPNHNVMVWTYLSIARLVIPMVYYDEKNGNNVFHCLINLNCVCNNI